MNNQQSYIIIGAGGHGKMIAALLTASKSSITGFIDMMYQQGSERKIFDFPILGGDEYLQKISPDTTHCALALGDNNKRHTLFLTLKDKYSLPVIVHPNAKVDFGVRCGEGTVIANSAIVGAQATLGKGVIVNTGAIIDHDCQIGDFAHISVGTRLAGNVKVGAFSFVGIGSTVIDGITIGQNTIIGAGSVVINNIPDGVMAAGVPAKIIKTY